MRTLTALIGGAIIGAGAALLLAPQSGQATRSLIKDKTSKCTRDTAEFAEKKSRHLRNKMKGYAHKAQDLVEKAQETIPQAQSVVGRASSALNKARTSMDSMQHMSDPTPVG